MRVRCPHCQKKAVVTHTVKITDKVSDLYINCQNPDCCARSVMKISYSATLIPPMETLTNAMHEWFANLPDSEKRSLARKYQPNLL